MKMERYDRGHLETSPGSTVKANTPVIDKDKKVEKTPEMLEWEKKNKGKKKALRDGRTSSGG
jgi:hypothetical protein